MIVAKNKLISMGKVFNNNSKNTLEINQILSHNQGSQR
jgi:hypothetical protein